MQRLSAVRNVPVGQVVGEHQAGQVYPAQVRAAAISHHTCQSILFLILVVLACGPAATCSPTTPGRQ